MPWAACVAWKWGLPQALAHCPVNKWQSKARLVLRSPRHTQPVSLPPSMSKAGLPPHPRPLHTPPCIPCISLCHLNSFNHTPLGRVWSESPMTDATSRWSPVPLARTTSTLRLRFLAPRLLASVLTSTSWRLSYTAHTHRRWRTLCRRQAPRKEPL